MKLNKSFDVFLLNHELVGLLIIIFMLSFPSISYSGVLFESSWNTTTGNCGSRKHTGPCTDGGKWDYDWGTTPVQFPTVYSGGPGGNNYMRFRTPGGGGWGNPYYINMYIDTASDVFQDPDDLYIRVYFRVNSDYTRGGPGKHWLNGLENASGSDSKHYLNYENTTGDIPGVTDYTYGIENYGDGGWRSTVQPDRDVWHRWEIHIHKVDASKEEWYIRLDGVDITDTFLCVDGACYGNWLDDWYNAGSGFRNEYHGTLVMATYDQEEADEGWDVAAIEVRDDTWPGAVGPVPPSPPKNLRIK